MPKKKVTKPIPILKNPSIGEVVQHLSNELKAKKGYQRSKLSAQQIINPYNKAHADLLFMDKLPIEYHAPIIKRYKLARDRLIKHLMNI